MRPAPAAARAHARWTKPGAENPARGAPPGALIASCDLHAPPAPRRIPSPDAQLVELMQERNVHAFELIYLRHAAAVFGLARRIVREQSVAEDVTQDVFMSVWRSCDRYQPDQGSVRSWVLRITHHRAIDEIRRRSSQDRLNAEEENFARWADETEPSEVEALRNVDARFVRRAVETLPGEQRRALELAYFAGLSHAEIAAALDVPLGTVKGRMRLGLNKLRGEIGPREGGLAREWAAAPSSSLVSTAPRGTTRIGQGRSLISWLDSDPSSTRRTGP